MPQEPQPKRVFAYVDGQNLFHAARECFGFSYPNFDPRCLADRICAAKGWELAAVAFYTGIPSAEMNPQWHGFWTAKLKAMEARGIHTFSRTLAYRPLPDPKEDQEEKTCALPRAREKGIDIRIALDLVRHAEHGRYDVALLFSQDSDLSEAVKDVREISREQDRWLKVACAFPSVPGGRFKRGVEGAEWIPISKALYRECLDPLDYRQDPAGMAASSPDEAWATWTPEAPPAAPRRRGSGPEGGSGG